MTEEDKIAYRRAYQREFYRKKYHNDETYKKNKKEATRSRYISKVIRCTNCFKKAKSDEVDELNSKLVNKDTFLCLLCANSTKKELKRGRPASVYSSGEDIEPKKKVIKTTKIEPSNILDFDKKEDKKEDKKIIKSKKVKLPIKNSIFEELEQSKINKLYGNNELLITLIKDIIKKEVNI